MGSRSSALADPMEPWAEPRPWQPPERPPRLQTQAAAPAFGRHGAEAPSALGVQEAPSASLPPEAPQIDAGAPAGQSNPSGPAPAVFQADLPSSDRLGSGLAAGSSPLGAPEGNYELEGYCPVCLLEKEQWVQGNPLFAVQHQGKVYLLAGPAQQQRFLANPGRYAPVGGGLDPVAAVEENRSLPGRTDYCVVYDGRLYLFSSPESLARFRQNPKKYASFARSGL